MAETAGGRSSGRGEPGRSPTANGVERRRRRQRSGQGAVPGPPADSGRSPGSPASAGQSPDAADGPTRPDPATSARTAEIHDPEPETTSGAPPGAGPAGTPADDKEVERGLRGLVGPGATQVSVGAALRARDAARPTANEVAAAEERLVIVRRGWVPRDELPRR
jgi:hypothetical protein